MSHNPPVSEFSLLLDDLAVVQQLKKRSQEIDAREMKLDRRYADVREREHRAADWKQFSKSLTEFQSNMSRTRQAMPASPPQQTAAERFPAFRKSLLDKTMDAFNSGAISAMQVAQIEARLIRLGDHVAAGGR